MQSILTIGLDIAKSVFQVHGVDAAGQVVVRRQLRRRPLASGRIQYRITVASILEALGAHIFFDEQGQYVLGASQVVPSGRVLGPHDPDEQIIPVGHQWLDCHSDVRRPTGNYLAGADWSAALVYEVRFNARCASMTTAVSSARPALLQDARRRGAARRCSSGGGSS
ncbi:hypothetical protein ABIF81_003582 [Bradyrhizobium daqingense]